MKTHSATAEALAPPPDAVGDFIWVDPTALMPSANPRRTPYPAAAFADLVQSVKSRGILQPLNVRPRGDGSYQVVTGDNRRLAALEAKLAHVPCVSRDLTDVDMLEIQLIENIQRQDMHPLDEGIAFATLVDSGHHTAESIGARVGKSTRWVQQRIAFSKLIPAAKEAFLAGTFTASHAELLVRVDADAQAKALNFIGEAGEGFPISVDELQHWMQGQTALDVTSPVVHAMFPELAAAHESAEADGAKLLQVGTVYGSAPDGVLNQRQWFLATGKNKCKLSESAVIVVGPNQGQVTTVCRNKACAKHWPVVDEQDDTTSPTSGKGTKGRNDAKRKRQEAQRAREAEAQERTEKLVKAARPSLVKHLVGLDTVPTSLVAAALLPALNYAHGFAAVRKAIGADPAKDPARALVVGFALKSWIAPKDFDLLVKASKFDLSPFDPDADKPVRQVMKPAAKTTKKARPVKKSAKGKKR